MKKFQDNQVNIKLKLSALWASVLSCYIYCDYFELYTPDKISHMITGTTIFGAGDQNTLLGLSSIMLVCSLMIGLCVLLPASVNRLINLIVAAFMTLMMTALTYIAGWNFYQMYAAIETLITLSIFWLAWKWPRALKP